MIVAIIIISIVAAIVCMVSIYLNLRDDNYGAVFFFGFLAILNILIAFHNIGKYNAKKNGETETFTIKNVKEYHIDSTIVITGADTTKTYILTITKDYE